MLAIITTFLMVNPWTVLSDADEINDQNQRVCQIVPGGTCSGVTCDELDATEECTTGLDGQPRCYWPDDDQIITWDDCDGTEGSGSVCNNLCDYDGDAACIALDGTTTFAAFGLYDRRRRNLLDYPTELQTGFLQCLRCCPASPTGPAAGHKLCKATIGEGKKQCGTKSIEAISISVWDQYNYEPQDPGIYNPWVTIAPCCEGQDCLDDVAGICGVAAGPCDPCTQWSYIIDEQNIFHTADSCGEGLKCMLDGSDPLYKYKPQQRYAELNRGPHTHEGRRRLAFDKGDVTIFDELPTEIQERHVRLMERRRLIDHPTYVDEMRYSRGVCIPETDELTCDNDSDCPGCLRCCGGTCKRIAESVEYPMCGFSDARGPCCKGYECCDGECVTPAPTKDTTSGGKPSGDDDSSSGSSDSGDSGAKTVETKTVQKGKSSDGSSSSD